MMRLSGVMKVIVAMSVAAAATIGAQSAPKPALAPGPLLNAVLSFRLVVGDATPISACSVSKLTDAPREFPNAFSFQVQNAFDRRFAVCDPVEEPVINPDTISYQKMREAAIQRGRGGCVRLDSARVADTTATVYASVVHGDAVHREDFKAIYATLRKTWVILEMRSYGLWYGARSSSC